MPRLLENKKCILFMEITYFPVTGHKACASFCLLDVSLKENFRKQDSALYFSGSNCCCKFNSTNILRERLKK